MSTVGIPLIRLAGDERLPLMVVGPSLGTTAEGLWSAAAADLGRDFHVVGWDLPGHGRSTKTPEVPFSMADLAAGLLAAVDEVFRPEAGFDYAGDSVAGAVGLQLLLDAPARVRSATLLCTAARIGTPEMWRERAATVQAAGTASMTGGASERWFAPGFLDREPSVGSTLLHALADVSDAGYAAVCEALADFDVRDRLADVTAPLLAVAGALDLPTPPADMSLIAETVADGRLVVLDDVGHLAPIEAPERVAALIRGHARRSAMSSPGMIVRRQVLGDAHVDRATANATDFTREFQELITQYAWGAIWTRPGLDRRARSMITLTALIARGHHEELAMHVRAARRNGLSVEEIKEVILQSAIYCGVPDANTAFRIAQSTLAETGDL